jgi:hypothetical protein
MGAFPFAACNQNFTPNSADRPPYIEHAKLAGFLQDVGDEKEDISAY